MLSLKKNVVVLPVACLLLTTMCGLSCQAADATDKEQSTEAPPLPIGVEIGRFAVRDSRPVDNEKYKLEFQLYAVVAPEEDESYIARYERNEHRVRDQVLTAVRLTPVNLFEEPDLASFRRRILLRLRRAIPELRIEQVLVTDFRMLSES